MKTKEPFLLTALIAVLCLALVDRLVAQTLTALHTLSGNEGTTPNGLVPSGDKLYGTAQSGGSAGHGTVFRLKTDGTGFTVLHSFSASSTNSAGVYTNEDGATPSANVVLSSNKLYGITAFGGSFGLGTAFAINTDGTGFTTLHHFTGGSDGANPNRLIFSGNALYGTAVSGGSAANGTVFKMATDGTGFSTLHSFTTGIPNSLGIQTNSDGASPSELILSGSTLYGATARGGMSSDGTVFKVNTDGTGFSTLLNYGVAGLIASTDTLYWVTLDYEDVPYPTPPFEVGPGVLTYYTLSRIYTDGTGLTHVGSFFLCSGLASLSGAGLISSGNTLYGTVSGSVRRCLDCRTSFGFGNVFAIRTDGTGFTRLADFSFDSVRGAVFPEPGLVLSGRTLFGTVVQDSEFFNLSFAPQLTMIPYGANAILTWPTNSAGFDYSDYTLQSSTNLGSSAIWNDVSPSPVVVGGQKVVLTPMSGAQQFYRLSQ
jgi:uncharacterized repeat protein (TIGR03803 family)